MAISNASWDGSAGRFSDAEYERSCCLDRKSCGSEWADKSPKARCSLPIKEPNGDLNRNAVHAAAARVNQVQDACSGAIDAAKAALRSAYKELGEDAPDSIDPGDSDEGTVKQDTDEKRSHRERALASLEHEWDFVRAAASDSAYLGTLVGHFAVFNRWTEIDSPFEGHFMERVAPGAFTKTFQENGRRIRCLLNHGKDPSVGLKPLGPIRKLEQDETGAYYEVELMDTLYNRELLPGLKEGQYGASFRFSVIRDEHDPTPARSADNPNGIPQTTITEAKVREFGPVTFGAYEDATSGLRSLNDELVDMDLRMMANADPYALASWARILTGGPPALVGANVGTTASNSANYTTTWRSPATLSPTRDEALPAESSKTSERAACDRSDQTSSPDEGAPVTKAPDRTARPYGSTLRRRAAPLRTKREQGEPQWKL